MPNFFGLRVDTRGLFSIRSIFAKVTRGYPLIFDKELGKLSKKIHKNVVKAAPKKTEKLSKNIDELKVSFLHYETREPSPSRVQYVLPVRLGVRASRINPIRPRLKKALWWPGLPHPISVVQNHPGIRPNDYYKVGLTNSERDLDKSAAIIGRKIQVKFIR